MLEIAVKGTFDHKIGNPQPIIEPSSQPASVENRVAPMDVHAMAGRQAPAPAPPAASALGAFGGGARNGPTVAPSHSQNVIPITALTPFNQRWTIRARVTQKGDIRTWSNAKGEGKLFSATLVDENATEIRATFFKAGVDRFYNELQVGRVYCFGNGRVKIADTRYSSIKNDQELSFDEKAVITESQDDARILKAVYNFAKIEKLKDVEPGKMVDIICVITAVADVADLQSKAGKALTKRDMTVADDSGASISLTLWDDKARAEYSVGDVLAVKGAKVSDYGTCSLSTTQSSTVDINPDHPRTAALAAWWPCAAGNGFTELTTRGGGGGGGAEGLAGPTTVVENRVTCAKLKEDAGANASPFGHMVKATLAHIKRDDVNRLFYPACTGTTETGKPCQKKLIDENSDGNWKCPRGCFCQVPLYRYICSATLIDASGSEYVTLFDLEALEVLGKTANDIQAACAAAGTQGSGQLPPHIEAVFRAALNQEYLFTCRAKMEERNDVARVNVTVIKVRKVSMCIVDGRGVGGGGGRG